MSSSDFPRSPLQTVSQITSSDSKENVDRKTYDSVLRLEKDSNNKEIVDSQKLHSLLTENFLQQYDNFPAEMNALGRFVFLRTYSRWLPTERRRESYKEVCKRVSEYNVSLGINHRIKLRLPVDYDKERKEAELLFDNIYNLRQCLSGRSMWVGGTKASMRSVLSNYNCSFITIDTWNAFSELFYALLVGTGVGFRCSKENAANLPKLRTRVKVIHSDYKPLPPKERLEHTRLTILENGYAKIYIGDSKEGWVQSLKIFLELLAKKEYEWVHTIKLSYNSIRPKGERLKTFGGQASGFEPVKELFEGVEKVIRGGYNPIDIDSNGYVAVRPVHVLDIGNLIGSIVVVGGVRRTAEIFLFDADDYESMFAKYGINGIWTDQQLDQHVQLGKRLDKLGIKPDWWDTLDKVGSGRPGLDHRRMSNNSIYFEKKPPKEYLQLVFDVMKTEGEPGFINAEEAKRRRPNFQGLNPCSEILMDSRGVCNLTTLNLVKFVSSDEKGEKKLDLDRLIEAQKLSARSGLRMTLPKLELEDWDFIQQRDRLLGCSMTGIKDMLDILGYDSKDENELIKILGDASRNEASRFAKELRVADPLLVNTVKPEGCSRRDMLISTNKGLLRLDEIGNVNGSQWQDLSNDGYIVPGEADNQKMTKFYVNGKTETRIIQTDSGDLVESSLEHRFKVIDDQGNYDWKKVKDIIAGDKLVLKINSFPLNNHPVSLNKVSNPYFKQPDELNKDIARFLGIITKEAQFENQGIKFTQCTIKFITWLETFMEKTFGLPVFKELGEYFTDVRIISKDFKSWLECNGFSSESLNAGIPKVIRTSNRESIISFIQGYRDPYNIYDDPVLHFDNEIIARQFFALLRAIGMFPQMYCTQMYCPYKRWKIRNSMDFVPTGGYFIDKVKNIENSTCETFDVEVDNSHHYLMNGGLISHNTLSQVFNGVSCGLHYSHSPHFIRRIRINANDPLAKAIKDLDWSLHPEVGTKGNTHEERMQNARTLVVDFPVSSGAKRTKEDVSVKEQLATYFSYQRLYTDHNSSNTITVRPNEWSDCLDIIYENWNDFVGVSFLQLDGGTYQLAPYEACSKDVCDNLQGKMKPLTVEHLMKYDRLQEEEDFSLGKVADSGIDEAVETGDGKEDQDGVINDTTTNDMCVGGVCPIR